MLTLLVIVIFLLAYKMYHDRSGVYSVIRKFQVTPKEDKSKVTVVSDQTMVIHSGQKRKLPNATKMKTTSKMGKQVNMSYSTTIGASQLDDCGERIEPSSYMYYPVATPLTNVMDSGHHEAKKKKKKHKRRKHKK